jgi:hypothetical protein
MSTHLAPCPSCARHVRVSEARCPFCDGGLNDTFHALPAPQPPMRRLKRAALYAVGASGLVLGACSSSSSNTMTQALYGGPPADAAADAADGGQVVALYGAPPADVWAPPADAGVDVQGVALYGGPPPQDAAVDVPQVMALYGAPPPSDSGSG